MRLACQKLNNRGVVISKTRVYEENERATKEYADAVYKLYSWGMNSSDSVFDESEFLDKLYDKFGVAKLDFFMSSSGMRTITPLTIEYGILRNQDDDDLVYYLSLYKTILQAIEDIKALKELFRTVRFKKTADLIQSTLKLQVTNKLRNTSIIPYDTSVTRRCFDLPKGAVVKEVTYNTAMRDVLLRELGISYDTTLDEPLFLKGCTKELELRLIPLICEGKIKCDGKFGAELVKTVQKYYRDFRENNSLCISCISFYEYIFEKTIESSSEVVHQLEKEHENIIYLTDTCYVYYDIEQERDGVEIKQILPARDYETGRDLSVKNRLVGFGGAFLSEESFKTSKLHTTSLPVRLYDNSGKLTFYYHSAFLFKSEDCNIPIKPLGNCAIEEISTYLKLAKCSTEEEFKLKAIQLERTERGKVLWGMVARLIESDCMDSLYVSYPTYTSVELWESAFEYFETWLRSLFS